MLIKIDKEFIEETRQGKMFILCDDASRENEGDLICPAEFITEGKMATMIRYTSGIVFLSMTNVIANKLELPLMVSQNSSRRQTPFTITIEAKEGVTTGVSAADRVKTIKTAISNDAKPSDLSRPGHVFPLRAMDGGVLERGGHTEGSVDLMKIAGLMPVAVGAELMNDNGTMMKAVNITEFARDMGLKIVSIDSIKKYLQEKSTKDL